MKKMFLLIPVGLIAAGGLIWIDSQNSVHQKSLKRVETSAKSPEQLFTMSQESLRLIMRHGDKESIPTLQKSVSELEIMMLAYEKQGLSTGKVENLIAQYKEDCTVLTQTAQPFLEKLKVYDQYEEEKEEKFLLSIDQIGLYELKSAYKKLSKIRLDYLKEPSSVLEEEYRANAEILTRTIKELYLDSAIEEPLYAYLENHNRYFETTVMSYKKAGTERIHRLRENSYAIKTELQMLPSL